MKQSFTANPGVSLTSIQIRGGVPLHGIVIDNPSGNWLFVVELLDYCPPYTLGWSRDFDYAGSAITIRAGNGPSGQVGTNAGDAYTVTLNTDPVGFSAGNVSGGGGSGSSFIQNFTPTLSNVTVILCFTSTFNHIGFIANPGGNKRIRLLTVFAHLGIPAGVAIVGRTWRSPCNVAFISFDGAISVYLRVSEATPFVVMPVNMDTTPNTSLDLWGQADWADTNVTMGAIYQLI